MERVNFTFNSKMTQSSASSYSEKNLGHVEINVEGWVPDSTPRAIVQISHGMQEYAVRYERFAKALVEEGFAVYASDHRGHGKSLVNGRLGHLGAGGWDAVLCDLHEVSKLVKERHPGLPLFLLGHSWGSFLAQAYIQRWGNELAGCILSGTNGYNPLAKVGLVAARLITRFDGPDTTATLLEKLTVGNFNDDFKGGPTGKEWLSRDTAEVRKYVDDPLCGQPFPNSFFVEMLALLNTIWLPLNEARIPKKLPVFMIAGSKDPVGLKGKGVLALAKRYKKNRMADVTWRIYEGARHEVLNETNRDEVTKDVIDWLRVHLAG